MPEDLILCPFCKTQIRTEFKQCPYCGSKLNDHDLSSDNGASRSTPNLKDTAIRLHSGQYIKDYEIISLLGQSTFGSVYETIYHGFDKDVKRAIKLIPGIVAKNKQEIIKLKHEVRIAS